jgi:hypothetical protein
MTDIYHYRDRVWKHNIITRLLLLRIAGNPLPRILSRGLFSKLAQNSEQVFRKPPAKNSEQVVIFSETPYSEF